ncbi:DUF4426 domain-containing protein [Lysobacter sp. N42]|uniref:DUF4426 domain-containing protein n=1 Tax=Lysobacter sp. N42 TaxID=2545719 RepID=UPI00104DFEAB|nr:DUF4426 domain-containing protein [Lysobacter sp. N42]TCZ83926.1 DUF4426 domain-containing protein [Lysobacter sp. N42]
MRIAIQSAGLIVALALAGCGGAPQPAPAVPASSMQEAVARAGDVTIRASVLPTVMLDERVARGYGIERSDRSAMLLVSLRRGPEGQETALPAQVLAKASDLRGRAQLVDMRELRSEGGLLDYVGTVEIDAPDTLRFDVQVTRADGATSSMQFTREFHPR